MDDTEPPRTGDPAAAFDQMRGELALLRRAVEGLAAEKEKAPDYNETLGTMDGRLSRIAHNIVLIAEHPAMKLTPDAFAEQMQAAAAKARREDQAVLAQARQQHLDAAHGLAQLHGNVATIREQRRRLLWAGGSGLLAGCLLWSFLPGLIARTLPTRWHLPERMAARAVGAPTVWDAGIRLMQAGNPQGWQAIVNAADMRRDNRETIAACEARAEMAKEPVRCTIMIRVMTN